MGARGRDPRKDKSLGAAAAARWGYYARQCGKSRAGGARLATEGEGAGGAHQLREGCSFVVPGHSWARDIDSTSSTLTIAAW